MAERLSQEIAQLLDEPDGGGHRQARTDAFVRARLSASIAEGLDQSSRPDAAGTGDLMRLAALLDHGLSPAERDAMLTALTQDSVGRAELSSAAELLGALDSTPQNVPPRLLARAVEAFDAEPLRGRPAIASWPSARPRRLSSRWTLGLAAVLLVAVATPTVWLVIGDRSDQGSSLPGGGLSDRGSEPTERGISDSGTNNRTAPQQKPAAPATSCNDKGPVAQPRETGKPERAKPAAAPTDDPCQSKPPRPDSGATVPAARN
jgi:hypothetical protein